MTAVRTAERTTADRPRRTPDRTRTTARPSVTRPRAAFWPTFVLLIGAAYSLLPVLWLFTAATKSSGELFTTFSLWPSFTGGFAENFQALVTTRDGRSGSGA